MKNIAIIGVLFLAGCASQKYMVATGGSKSDGIVNMSYEYGMFEKPVVDYAGAQTSATQRCKAWGYEHAESFGGQQNHCQAYNGYGNCVRMMVTVPFQCMD